MFPRVPYAYIRRYLCSKGGLDPSKQASGIRMAFENNWYGCAKVMLEHVSNDVERGELINREELLYITASNKSTSLEMVDYLLEKGADQNKTFLPVLGAIEGETQEHKRVIER